VVLAQGARDETVVGRVLHRAVQDAVDFDHAGFLVQLVLGLGTFGDFDDGRKDVRNVVAQLHVMPRMKHNEGCFLSLK